MTLAVDANEALWLIHRLSAMFPGLRRPNRVETASLRQTDLGGAALVQLVCHTLQLAPPQWSKNPGPGALPMLAVVPDVGFCLLYAQADDNHWLCETPAGRQRLTMGMPDATYTPLAPRQPDTGTAEGAPGERPGSARRLFAQVVRAQRPSFMAAALASLLANVIALAGSLYSMQVYDRVIPTQALSTLTVLTIGALLACVFELVVKLARSALLDTAVRRMDVTLSHGIFQRLVGVRADQLPPSIGSLSAQVRGHEGIRAFVAAATMYAAVDAPFALLFLGVMGMIAGLELVAVTAVFFVVAMAVGLMYRARIAAHARTASNAANRKAGLLVETIENAENLKADGTGWAQTAKWNALSRQAIDDEMVIKHCSEQSALFAGFVQQTSYIVMIGVGAWIASTTSSLTTGGLIACSILSGRVLAPIGMLPGLIVQWAHARTALENLERIFALEQDNHGVEQPLVPASVKGAYRLEDIRFAYPGRPPAVSLPLLAVRPGEKVAVLGPIGAGKSTLLKIMAGLYKPQQGRVLLDGLELQHIARDQVSQHLGYLPQEVRLVAGTLRENLVTGLPGLHDDGLMEACRATGLSALVASHPKGLDMEIGEGGTGVSGGQRRLVGLTRLLLSCPSVWLLDEPTASMDEATERQTLLLLQQTIAPRQTLVVVTHKPQLLSLVHRIVVLTAEGIALDGPRDTVLRALSDNAAQQQAAAAAAQPVADVVDIMEAA
jgi:ATP-binding cassette subfamily C protein LapB